MTIPKWFPVFLSGALFDMTIASMIQGAWWRFVFNLLLFLGCIAVAIKENHND